MHKAVIIEDEERSRNVLQNLVESYCQGIEIVGFADSVDSGVMVIKEKKPEILFLDIQLLDGTGFDILEKARDFNGAVIFTTAFDQYALKAFKFSAIDYLLKPIDIEELKRAVERATSVSGQEHNSQKIEHLLTNLKRQPDDHPVLLISTIEAIEFIRIQDIGRCEAQGAYCKLHMKDGKYLLASKVIKEFEFLLREYAFFRIHQSHLVNLSEVKKYVKAHSSVIMRDGKELQVARSRKDDFLKAMRQMSQ